VSRDVVFNVSPQWNWGVDGAGEEHVSDTFTIEYTLAQEDTVIGMEKLLKGKLMLKIVQQLCRILVVLITLMGNMHRVGAHQLQV
jgi:hypothetical protein